jgi:two-component system response regulator GlrR
MHCKFLIFTDFPGIISDRVRELCKESLLSCECVYWDHNLLSNCFRADLILLWHVDEPQSIIHTLEMLSREPLGSPILTVLPAKASPNFIELATRSSDDFILAPIRAMEFRQRVNRLLAPLSDPVDDVSRRLTQEFTAAGLIGRNPQFMETLSRIPLAARTDAPVLITGETGTGKELIARAIHNSSGRRDCAFIPVDCGCIPDHLFENEMFGHVRGAFTDARNGQSGLAGLANGGSLFLDEIDSLSASAQAKFLRFLQDRTYRPLGSDRFLRADVKILAATNKDLNQLVSQGNFRSDLLFRLSVLKLDLAPLRERPGDIPLLARFFTDTLCTEHNFARKTLTRAALSLLEQYHWPGNVRELHNVIQRAVIFSETSQIVPRDLGPTWRQVAGDGERTSFREARAKAIEMFERSYVENLLRECGGNVSMSARIAQKERRAFGRLVKRYQVKERIRAAGTA